MSLFTLMDCVLHSGARSPYKINCDFLQPEDWECLAFLGSQRLPPFGLVEGVPTGGLKFAAALRKYQRACSCSFPHPPHDWCEGKPLPLLLAEDVTTTGDSLEKHRAGRDAIGVVFINRGVCPAWCVPILNLTPALEGRS